MKFKSDKSIKIYNEVKILYIREKDSLFFEKLCIELSKFFQNKKVFWFFYSKRISLVDFTSSIVGEVKNSSNLIIFFPSNLNKTKINYTSSICNVFGKKLITISNNNINKISKNLIAMIEKI
jgi:hypothetical protein